MKIATFAFAALLSSSAFATDLQYAKERDPFLDCTLMVAKRTGEYPSNAGMVITHGLGSDEPLVTLDFKQYGFGKPFARCALKREDLPDGVSIWVYDDEFNKGMYKKGVLLF